MKPSIALLLLALAGRAAAAEPPPEAFVQSYAQSQDFSGTVLIQEDGGRVYRKSFGLANRQLGVANTPRTRFAIASITKLFTSTLILKLHDQGALDLQKPIRRYLPSYSGEGGDSVTIHHLLNHTSGIESMEKPSPETFAKPWFDVYQKPWTTDQILEKFCSGKLEQPPGAKFSYNNGDYVILGKILEAIHKAPYEQVLRQAILEPLALQESGLVYQAKIVENLASTYSRNETSKVVENDRPAQLENWYAAGAMYSTADDLLTFANALFRGQLLKPATLALMLQPGDDQYGYGLWIRDLKIDGQTYRTAQRFGRIRGINTVMYRVLDRDLTVIILSNTSGVDMGRFAYRLTKQSLLGWPADAASPAETTTARP